MRPSTRPTAVDAPSGVSGTIRMDRRTGSLLRRLRPGDIAVLDHLDLDRANAEALVARGVVAVVNASAFVSGRYPNLGPELLARSGVLLLDEVGPTVFTRLRDGRRARVQDGAVLVGDVPVVRGRELGGDEAAGLAERARSDLVTRLESFTHNASEFLRREQDLLLEGQGIPETLTPIEGRPVVVVAPGAEVRADLRALRPFIREQRPVLMGVDAGADALLDAGHRPDIVLVGPEGLAPGSVAAEHGGTVSDRALGAARDVVLHADRTGHALGSDRLSRLGVRHRSLSASGRSEDAGLLLADVRGASLLVTVGTSVGLAELLDPGRSGLPATFLTRLRVGPRLMDARTVPQLYVGRVRPWHLVLVLLAGLVALAVAVATTPVGQQWWSELSPSTAPWLAAATDRLSQAWAWLEGLFS